VARVLRTVGWLVQLVFQERCVAFTFKDVRRPCQWVTRVLVASIITRSIDGLGVRFPEVSDQDRKRLAAARSVLLAHK
jgi:hypothetical protein